MLHKKNFRKIYCRRQIFYIFAIFATSHCQSVKLLAEYIQCDKYELEDEWNQITIQFSETEKSEIHDGDVETFWSRAMNGDALFPNLEKLSSYVLTHPHSNAAAERCFSMLTDLKSKTRTRLGKYVLNSLIRSFLVVFAE